MTTHELIEQLKSNAEDFGTGKLSQFGDDMRMAAATLRSYVNAMDAIYNHNEAVRAAVIQHFGIHHKISIDK